ncbi:MAG: DUF3842 family protein [Deltaproteobacteria bacterium]|nr:DUF3842 family protein [Deltaproteobacteria bacterium]
MKLMIMDGQGGGIAAALIKGLRRSLGNDLEILAIGTNSMSTSAMLKAGANKGATGENAVVQTAKNVDIIIGPIAILMADSMMGEVTSKMATAVSSSQAKKIIIPLTQENLRLVGVSAEPLPHLVDQVIEIIKAIK